MIGILFAKAGNMQSIEKWGLGNKGTDRETGSIMDNLKYWREYLSIYLSWELLAYAHWSRDPHAECLES